MTLESGEYKFGPGEKLELLRYMCRRSFLAFCLAVKKDFVPSKFHVLLAHKLQDVFERVEANEDVRLMIEVPPRHGKTTMVSILFPAWVLGKKNWPYICASYGSTLAERNSEQSREVVQSDALRAIFPKTRVHPDSTSKEFWRTVRGGSYRAAGVGSALSGMGGKILACDDPFKDRADADSEVIRESTWKWWQSVFFTRREGRAGVILLNTRWHLDDLSGKLLEQEKTMADSGLRYDHWERFRFPAIAEEDEFIDGEEFRKAGEALWPEKFPLSDLEKTKNSIDIYEWSSLYQQSPILSENQEFKTEWFRYFEQEDIDNKVLDVYVMVDLAISEKKTAHNTSIQVAGKERQKPQIYHLEEKTGRFNQSVTIDYLFDLKKKYGSRLKAVGIEAIAYQYVFFNLFKEKMREKQIYMNFIELRASAAKSERIQGLIPYYKNGVIYHRKNVDKDLELELLSFPKGKRDDRIDAWAYLEQVIRPTSFSGEKGSPLGKRKKEKKFGLQEVGPGIKRYIPKSTTYK